MATSLRISFLVYLALLLPVPAEAQEMTRSKWHLVAQIGGWALSPDTMTLIVSESARGELLFFDTTGEKDTLHLAMQFKPTALAVQGNMLYAAAEGSGIIHVINLEDHKTVKQIRVAGGAVQKLACHPKKGFLYAALTDNKIVAIDPSNGSSALTLARGQSIAVDPVDPANVYVSINFSSQEVMDLMKLGDNMMRLEFKRVTPVAMIMRYRAEGKSLRFIRANGNSSVGYKGELDISPDGRAITLISPGGWWDVETNRRMYDVAFFQTNDMKTVLGSLVLGGPRSVAFHPVLDLLAGQGGNGQVTIYQRKSQIEKARLFLPNFGPHQVMARQRNPQEMVAFVAKGTRLMVMNVDTIHFVDLELNDEERATLKTKYGELPSRHSAVAQVSTIPALDKPIDLISTTDVIRDTIWGDWVKSENKLQGSAEARLRLRTPPVPEEYAVTLMADRLDTKGGLALSMPTGTGRMLLTADFGYQQSAGGLGFLDARNAFDTSNARWGQPVFTGPGKPATLMVVVRKTGVVVLAEGKKIVDWKGDPNKFHSAPGPTDQYHNQHERWYFPDRPGMFVYLTGRFRLDKLELGPIPQLVAIDAPMETKPGIGPLGRSLPRSELPPGTANMNPPGGTPPPTRANSTAKSNTVAKVGKWNQLKPGNFEVKDTYLSNHVDHDTPMPGDAIATKENYSGAMQIKAVVRLDQGKGDIRLFAYQTALMIINPNHADGIGIHLRRPGSPKLYAGTAIDVGPTPVSFKEWATIIWRITDRGMSLYIDGQLVLLEQRRLDMTSEGPVCLCGYQGTLDVQSLEVTRLKNNDELHLPGKKTTGPWAHLLHANYQMKEGHLQNVFSAPSAAPTLAVSTNESYTRPIEVNAVVRSISTDKNGDVRLFAFRSGVLIFNPTTKDEGGGFAVRLPDAKEPYAGTLARPGACPADFKDWTKITWRIASDGMTVLVNDKEVYQVKKTFDLSVGGPVRVGGYQDLLEIKSLEVKPLK